MPAFAGIVIYLTRDSSPYTFFLRVGASCLKKILPFGALSVNS